MSTATAPNEVKTYERNAKDERAHNLSINGDKPLVQVKGTNTFPLKGLFSVFGGKWDKETQSWFVPDHKWHEAQTAADVKTAEKAAADAKKAAKATAPVQPKPTPVATVKPVAAPVVTITAAQVQQAAPVPAPVVSTDRLVFRIHNLLNATTELSKTVTNEAVKLTLSLAIDALTLAGQEALAAAAK